MRSRSLLILLMLSFSLIMGNTPFGARPLDAPACRDLVMSSADKLVRLVKIWLETEDGRDAHKRSQLFDTL